MLRFFFIRFCFATPDEELLLKENLPKVFLSLAAGTLAAQKVLLTKCEGGKLNDDNDFKRWLKVGILGTHLQDEIYFDFQNAWYAAKREGTFVWGENGEYDQDMENYKSFLDT